MRPDVYFETRAECMAALKQYREVQRRWRARPAHHAHSGVLSRFCGSGEVVQLT
jgi:hypothetical protein